MRASLESSAPVARDPRGDVRFVPAGWVVAVVGAARFVLSRGKFGKLGIAALVWSVTPRRLKLLAAGLVAAALIVVAGSLAALALLALQLS